MSRSTKNRLYWCTTPASFIASSDEARVGKPERISVPTLMTRMVESLLAQGGHTVVIPFPEVDMTPLFMDLRGKLAPPKSTKLLKGEPSACHANAAKLWKRAPKTTRFVTGYALSADGMWRRHSWVMRGETLIETTLRRKIYDGFVPPAALVKRLYEIYCE